MGLYRVLNVGFQELEREKIAVHTGDVVDLRKVNLREVDEADSGEGKGGGWWWGGGKKGVEGKEGDKEGVVAAD